MKIMQEFFLTSLVILIITLTVSIWPTCCNNSQKRKKGKKHRRSHRYNRSHLKSNKLPQPAQLNQTPILTPVQVKQKVNEIGEAENAPAAVATPVAKEDEKKDNSDTEDEMKIDKYALCRCRDYTPQVFKDFDSLFELLL